MLEIRKDQMALFDEIFQGKWYRRNFRRIKQECASTLPEGLSDFEGQHQEFFRIAHWFGLTEDSVVQDFLKLSMHQGFSWLQTLEKNEEVSFLRNDTLGQADKMTQLISFTL